MKKIISAICGFVLLSFSAVAEEQNPYEVVKEVSTSIFSRLANEQAQIQKDTDHLRDIIREELLPHVDYKYAGYKVIGKNIKKTTKEQRDRFVIAFRDYLVTTYAQLLGQYDKQKISFEPGKPFQNRKLVAARVIVIDGNRPPIKIDFKLRKSKKTKEWKAFDMVAEGISLLSSKESELGPLIRKKGIDAVTADLKAKSEAKLVIEKRF